MELEGRISCSGDGGFGPNSLTRTEKFLKVRHILPYMFWQNISVLKTSSTSSKAGLNPLKSCKMALIRWELCRLRHPAHKKCCDWKPGKLMSLHFYLLNLYRLLCQDLWGFSVPSLVIVFSLFAWESWHFFMKLGGIHLPTFSHGKDRGGGTGGGKITVNYGYCCSEIKMTKKCQEKKNPVLKGSKGWIFHNCIWAAMRRNKS